MTSIQKGLSFHSENDTDNDILALAFIQSPIAMLILDENVTIIKTNLAFNELTGYSETDIFGKHISLLESNQNESSLYDICYKNTVQSEHNDSWEMYVKCKNEVDLLVRTNSKNMISHNKHHIILTLDDVSEHKKILEHYQYLSKHDALTGLANRVLLHENFKKAQQRAIRHTQKIALLVCDINEFKQFNDRCGHELGDCVLKTVAKTLEKVLRANDTVSRYGGDEFVLILEEIDHIDQIIHIITKIKAAFSVTCINGKEEYKINLSIGSACFPNDGYSFNQLIAIADKNMYQDKNDFYNSDKNLND